MGSDGWSGVKRWETDCIGEYAIGLMKRKGNFNTGEWSTTYTYLSLTGSNQGENVFVLKKE